MKKKPNPNPRSGGLEILALSFYHFKLQTFASSLSLVGAWVAMAAQQQKHQKMVEDQENVDGMQHGPFPVEQLQVESGF